MAVGRALRRLPGLSPGALRRGRRCAAGLVLAGLMAMAAGGTAAAGGSVRSGTAFFVSPAGYLLTSAHVVTGCSRVPLWPLDGRQHEAAVVARDRVRDIALLSTGEPAPAYVAPALGAMPQIGQQLATVGFGVLQHAPRQPVVNHGPLIGYAATEFASRTLIIGVELPEGNSGGPVVDTSGTLVGMVIGRFREAPLRGVALPVDELAKFSARLGAVASWQASLGDPVEDVTSVLYGVSGLIQCVPGG
jgi:S1-C subfamily serine protease